MRAARLRCGLQGNERALEVTGQYFFTAQDLHPMTMNIWKNKLLETPSSEIHGNLF
jgi:hypothetical protein